MSSECKLCTLLGANTSFTDISPNDGDLKTHTELHASQVDLITSIDDSIDSDTRAIPNGSNVQNGHLPKKRLTRLSHPPDIYAFCRELFNIHGKDFRIECSQCKISIKSQSTSIVGTASKLINHACIHLNKDLYACRHCDMKFVTRHGILTHLHNMHTMNLSSGNYIDMTDGHQNDITDMVNLCFGKAPPKQISVTEYGKQKRNCKRRTPLLKLAHSIIAKYRIGDRIQCRQCTTSLIYSRNARAAKHLIEHARMHCGKPIFSCRLCQYSASTDTAIRLHLIRKHSVAGSNLNFKDASAEYFEEISLMMEGCFGEMKMEKKDVITKEQEGASRRQRMIQNRYGLSPLITARRLRCIELAQKFQQSGKLQCRLCQTQLSMGTGIDSKYSTRLSRHSMLHFNKALFTCRRCSYTSTNKHGIGMHVRSVHGVPEINEFDDRTDDFHSDFMDMLSKCFDWDLEPEGSIRPGIADQKNWTMKVVSRTHDNDLKAARLLRVYELTQKHATDGKIMCRLCSYSVNATKKCDGKVSVGSIQVFSHARTHLVKKFRPYRCKLCSYMSANASNVRCHLRQKHKGKGTNEFDDLSDKLHSEIMDVVSKCYDWSNETGDAS